MASTTAMRREVQRTALLIASPEVRPAPVEIGGWPSSRAYVPFSSFTGNSALKVQRCNGFGLTLIGTSLSSLSIDPSQMDLIFNLNLNNGQNWGFRWQDPSGGGNWITTLDGVIGAGQIAVTAPQGYSVFDQNGYAYIGISGMAVPEPSSLVLACIADVGAMIGVNWYKRRTDRSC
jgi:hypothetical protein